MTTFLGILLSIVLFGVMCFVFTSLSVQPSVPFWLACGLSLLVPVVFFFSWAMVTDILERRAAKNAKHEPYRDNPHGY